MKIITAQLNAKLGAMDENVSKALEVIEYAQRADEQPDLVVLPPFFVSGYPLGGLLFSDTFLASLAAAHERLAEETPMPILTSAFISEFDAETGAALVVEERVCLFHDGAVDVLEGSSEQFYELASFELGGMSFAAVLGEVEDLVGEGVEADCVVNLVDTTYDIERPALVDGEMIADDRAFALETGSWLIRCGCVGAQDSAIFPGASYSISPKGELTTDVLLFDEALLSLSIDSEEGTWEASLEEIDDRDYGFSTYLDAEGIDDEAADWGAICLGTRDYILKNNMSDVVIGLSGGMDSSVVAVVAADALGSEHVHGVLMPSVYSSQHSIDDSLDLAQRIGIETMTIPITGPFEAFDQVLAEPCGGAVEGLTRENLQARIRTVYVMALSNRYGWTMLNTGNKSEAAVGYSTLYGDTCGAYAPVGNIYKTRLYELAEWRNEQSAVIPQNVLDKAPSAELHPDQRDDDTLPPYEILDGICNLYLEFGCSADEIVEEGFDPAVVNRVLNLITNNEYKRANEPIGPWVDGVSLKDDRAWPITCAYRDRSTKME
ncbi:MAG: NAD(+) synthase [Coriobacteriales bacterium]|jgi:NAD+ synthetase